MESDWTVNRFSYGSETFSLLQNKLFSSELLTQLSVHASLELHSEVKYLYVLIFSFFNCYSISLDQKKEKNSMVWVRERTIPTERPPLVGEVIANFCG
jgi:hypothetical protein